MGGSQGLGVMCGWESGLGCNVWVGVGWNKGQGVNVLFVAQSLMTAVMERLPGAVPAYRRMAASTLHTITTHCRHPSTQAHWAISKLLGQLVWGPPFVVSFQAAGS